ncbi:AAA family ATPase [Billgrantia antri]|uniref:AAA family ATPase n=1 Tax=Billgrantia antri TaxID=2846777 RepID=UPI001F5E5B3C|nr:AAA family ATPase [Halomonas sulfidivorans]
MKEYVKYSKRIKPIVKKIAQGIIVSGGTVVIYFPANTTTQRAWFKSIYSEVGAKHELIYLDQSDDVCLARIAQRRLENPERQRTDTEEMFYQVTKYFEEPSESEGFNIVLSGGPA